MLVLGGLCVGSFLNVCIHRLPTRTSIVFPASRCPSCGHALSWKDNIPVVSYVWLRGRCRYCGVPISVRYPIVEALTCGVFVLHWFVFGPTPSSSSASRLRARMIVLFAIDLEHQILPNVITLPGIVVGFCVSLFLPPGPVMSLAGIALGGGLLWAIAEAWYRLRKVEAMGFGDVKMLAMVGAFLGVKLVILTSCCRRSSAASWRPCWSRLAGPIWRRRSRTGRCWRPRRWLRACTGTASLAWYLVDDVGHEP